jgi:hypothetical protein
MDPRSLGAQALLLAVFRQAVCDLHRIAYGHDGPLPVRRVRAAIDSEAATFLQTDWAGLLADRAGLSIWELRRRAFGTDRRGLVRPHSCGGRTAEPPQVRSQGDTAAEAPWPARSGRP